MPPDVLRAATDGKQPTDAEVDAATALGPMPPPEPEAPEYTGLSAGAWLRLLGEDVVLRTRQGALEGRLRRVAYGTLVGQVEDRLVTLERRDRSSVGGLVAGGRRTGGTVPAASAARAAPCFCLPSGGGSGSGDVASCRGGR